MVKKIIFLFLLFECVAYANVTVILPKKKKTDKIAQSSVSTMMGSSGKIEPISYHGKTFFLYGAEHLKLENNYFDFPVVYNDAVKKWINYFLNRGRGFFSRYSGRAGKYAPILGKILEDHGLPRDLIFLAMAESGFRPSATSWAAAVGPWQFMPATGKRFGLDISWFRDERRDPIKSTIAAAKYLKRLHNYFGSWELAAAAYNAGEGKVSRSIKRYGTENFWDLRKYRYLKDETKNYVPKIMALAIIGKNLKSFGFGDIDFHDPLDFDEVSLPPKTDLVAFAKDNNIDLKELKELNPELLTWITPPIGEDYLLRVPVGTTLKKVDFSKYLAEAFQTYKIRSNRAKLAQVARKFKLRPAVLKDLNDLSYNRPLRKGTTVILPFRVGDKRKSKLYASVYRPIPRKSVRRRRKYKKRVRLALRRGKKIKRPSKFYVVKRGDSLWSVSRKTGTNLDTLIASNIRIIRSRQIRVGDRLAYQ
ncbi:MAG: lytic transglycosylase [Epsilonproteobacteria bacterium]|nr:MAG: lytic transglycosylase [Campylobacterota bacterium]